MKTVFIVGTSDAEGRTIISVHRTRRGADKAWERLRRSLLADACLWFETQERTDQISLIQRVPTEKTIKGCYAEVPRDIGVRVRGWHFPLHTMAVVTAAAVLGFKTLPQQIQTGWIGQVYLKVGVSSPTSTTTTY